MPEAPVLGKQDSVCGHVGVAIDSCLKQPRINANKREWEEDMNSDEILCKDEVYQIVGCAMQVLNGIGHGFHEKPYENALVVEFAHNKILTTQQPHYDIVYRGTKVGQFVPDLIAFGRVVVDTKVVDQITDHDRGRMLNYLRITGLKVGVLLNFKHPKLEWERIVLDRAR